MLWFLTRDVNALSEKRRTGIVLIQFVLRPLHVAGVIVLAGTSGRNQRGFFGPHRSSEACEPKLVFNMHENNSMNEHSDDLLGAGG